MSYSSHSPLRSRIGLESDGGKDHGRDQDQGLMPNERTEKSQSLEVDMVEDKERDEKIEHYQESKEIPDESKRKRRGPGKTAALRSQSSPGKNKMDKDKDKDTDEDDRRKGTEPKRKYKHDFRFLYPTLRRHSADDLTASSEVDAEVDTDSYTRRRLEVDDESQSDSTSESKSELESESESDPEPCLRPSKYFPYVELPKPRPLSREGMDEVEGGEALPVSSDRSNGRSEKVQNLKAVVVPAVRGPETRLGMQSDTTRIPAGSSISSQARMGKGENFSRQWRKRSCKTDDDRDTRALKILEANTEILRPSSKRQKIHNAFSSSPPVVNKTQKQVAFSSPLITDSVRSSPRSARSTKIPSSVLRKLGENDRLSLPLQIPRAMEPIPNELIMRTEIDPNREDESHDSWSSMIADLELPKQREERREGISKAGAASSSPWSKRTTSDKEEWYSRLCSQTRQSIDRRSSNGGDSAIIADEADINVDDEDDNELLNLTPTPAPKKRGRGTSLPVSGVHTSSAKAGNVRKRSANRSSIYGNRTATQGKGPTTREEESSDSDSDHSSWKDLVDGVSENINTIRRQSQRGKQAPKSIISDQEHQIGNSLTTLEISTARLNQVSTLIQEASEMHNIMADTYPLSRQLNPNLAFCQLALVRKFVAQFYPPLETGLITLADGRNPRPDESLPLDQGTRRAYEELRREAEKLLEIAQDVDIEQLKDNPEDFDDIDLAAWMSVLMINLRVVMDVWAKCMEKSWLGLKEKLISKESRKLNQREDNAEDIESVADLASGLGVVIPEDSTTADGRSLINRKKEMRTLQKIAKSKYKVAKRRTQTSRKERKMVWRRMSRMNEWAKNGTGSVFVRKISDRSPSDAGSDA